MMMSTRRNRRRETDDNNNGNDINININNVTVSLVVCTLQYAVIRKVFANYILEILLFKKFILILYTGVGIRS